MKGTQFLASVNNVQRLSNLALRNGYKHSKDSEPFLNLCDIPEIYFN